LFGGKRTRPTATRPARVDGKGQEHFTTRSTLACDTGGKLLLSSADSREQWLMLWTNLRNQVRQTPLPKWKPLIPLFEAVMNSFQAIRDARIAPRVGLITIEIEHETGLFSEEDQSIYAFKVTDNGIGLNDANYDSFNTAFSDYKLSRGGKGLGRFTWLKAFERVEIESVFTEPDAPTLLLRRFVFDEDYDPDKVGLPVPAPDRTIGTSVRLVGFREPYRGECSRSIDQLVQKLVEHFLLIFLESDCPIVRVRGQSLSYSANEIFEKDFKATAAAHSFTLKTYPFTLYGFRLTTPRLLKHKLVYAANQRTVVVDNLEEYLPNLNGRLADEDGNSFVYLGIVQSPYLTQRVNPARTDFDFGPVEDADVEQASLFAAEEVRRSEIRDECTTYIQRDLADIIRSINEAKEESIRVYVQAEAPQYRILLKYSKEFIDKISPVASKVDMETALHRELYQREVKMKAEGSRIIREAEKLDDYEGYYQRFTEFMERYNELGVSALAQYVTHRKIILEFLERAISTDGEDGKYPLERVVHQLVYPMRFTSDEIPIHEQNLWMIDERLTFHSFIASDKRLSSLDRLEVESERRPDLLIFDEKIVFTEGEHPIGSIVTIEFKRPGRDDYTTSDNPIIQSFKLIEDIRSGHFKVRGRNVAVANPRVPARAYCICDITPTLAQALKDMDASATPDNQGYYGFHRRYSIYYEVIDYSKLLSDAQKRNRIFFDKLNLIRVR
jgi:hypothetical protein